MIPGVGERELTECDRCGKVFHYTDVEPSLCMPECNGPFGQPTPIVHGSGGSETGSLSGEAGFESPGSESADPPTDPTSAGGPVYGRDESGTLVIRPEASPEMETFDFAKNSTTLKFEFYLELGQYPEDLEKHRIETLAEKLLEIIDKNSAETISIVIEKSGSNYRFDDVKVTSHYNEAPTPSSLSSQCFEFAAPASSATSRP
jgi:hypothetical protein